MAIRVRHNGPVAVVEVQGDVTFGSGALGRPLNLKGEAVDDVGATIGRLLDDERAMILLDMHSVRFIDSAGIGEMVAFKKRAVERGGDVKLLNPSERVRQLIEIVRLNEIFEIFDDEESGVGSF
ncbi:MAG: STAS domain-containing protein [Acidobacteriota bacterium]|nr:STAS domain-containing protein [Acidobacteriota bacterium]